MAKMTRREALVNVITHLRDCENYANEDWREEIAILDNMVAQIDEQAARPRSKSTARLQNEPLARNLIEKMREHDKPVTAKWISEHVRFVTTSQKAVAVAKIAEEWGEIERVMIEKRPHYQLKK